MDSVFTGLNVGHPAVQLESVESGVLPNLYFRLHEVFFF